MHIIIIIYNYLRLTITSDEREHRRLFLNNNILS